MYYPSDKKNPLADETDEAQQDADIQDGADILAQQAIQRREDDRARLLTQIAAMLEFYLRDSVWQFLDLAWPVSVEYDVQAQGPPRLLVFSFDPRPAQLDVTGTSYPPDIGSRIHDILTENARTFRFELRYVTLPRDFLSAFNTHP